MSTNLEQSRAARAWECAVSGVGAGAKEYVGIAKSAPALIVSNGLMQTLAFYRAKSKRKAYELVLDQTCQWLAERLAGEPLADGGRFPDSGRDFSTIMNALFQCDSDLYRRATRESLELFKWIRHFADAVNKDQSGAS